MSKLFLLLLMFFFHVLDDYRLQGILASMKQKKWMEVQNPDAMYRCDYVMALIVHSYSWAFMVMLPIAIYYQFEISVAFCIALIVNGAIHGIVDDLKANKLKINLVTDQMIHFLQILVTAVVLV